MAQTRHQRQRQREPVRAAELDAEAVQGHRMVGRSQVRLEILPRCFLQSFFVTFCGVHIRCGANAQRLRRRRGPQRLHHPRHIHAAHGQPAVRSQVPCSLQHIRLVGRRPREFQRVSRRVPPPFLTQLQPNFPNIFTPDSRPSACRSRPLKSKSKCLTARPLTLSRRLGGCSRGRARLPATHLA